MRWKDGNAIFTARPIRSPYGSAVEIAEGLAVFNGLTSQEMLLAIGRVLRATADIEGPLDDYQRSQLLSAYSVSRLLAAEDGARAALLASLRSKLGNASRVFDDARLSEAVGHVASCRDAAEAGQIISTLLEELPRDAAHSKMRDAVHGVLREIVDLEVAALAAAPRDGLLR